MVIQPDRPRCMNTFSTDCLRILMWDRCDVTSFLQPLSCSWGSLLSQVVLIARQVLPVAGAGPGGLPLPQPICTVPREEADRCFLFRDHPHTIYHGDVHGWNRRHQTRYAMVCVVAAAGDDALISRQFPKYCRYPTRPIVCVRSPGLPAWR